MVSAKMDQLYKDFRNSTVMEKSNELRACDRWIDWTHTAKKKAPKRIPEAFSISCS